jgi:hypothetical protein
MIWFKYIGFHQLFIIKVTYCQITDQFRRRYDVKMKRLLDVGVSTLVQRYMKVADVATKFQRWSNVVSTSGVCWVVTCYMMTKKETVWQRIEKQNSIWILKCFIRLRIKRINTLIELIVLISITPLHWPLHNRHDFRVYI